MFKKIPFVETEMEAAFQLPGFPGRPGPIVRKAPVSPRQNAEAMYWDHHPYYMSTATTQGLRNPWNAHMGRGGPEGLVDDLGIEWVFEPTAGGSIVHPEKPQLMEDVNDWKEKVHLPDPETWDWEAAKAETELDYRLPLQVSFTNGFGFERMISMMGFVPAAMSLLDDEQTDAIKEMLQAFADFGCKCIRKYCEVFPSLDVINIHDDWGSQQSTFFSEDIAREIFLPYLKQMTDCIHEQGRIASLHSCGHNDKRTQVFIDAGFDEWQPQDMNDFDYLFENFADKILLYVWEDTTELLDKSEEEQREAARKFFDRFNKPGKFTMLSSHMTAAPKAYLDEIYRYSRVRYAEW